MVQCWCWAYFKLTALVQCSVAFEYSCARLLREPLHCSFFVRSSFVHCRSSVDCVHCDSPSSSIVVVVVSSVLAVLSCRGSHHASFQYRVVYCYSSLAPACVSCELAPHNDEGECDRSSSDEGGSDAVIGVMREKVMTVMEGSLR
jgi:hypothetical protein